MKDVWSCPVNDFTCPYCDNKGNCTMYPKEMPWEHCDEAAAFFESEIDDCDYEVGYDPYLGCFSDDC